MYSMKEKILRALIEGNFCKKIIDKIDRDIGLIMRKFISRNKEIIPNKIMFMNYQNDYACNPKYICEELLRQNVNCDIVFVVKNINRVKKNFPKKIRLVKRHSYDFYIEAMSAKIWVDNALNFFYEDVPKRNDQIFINTWHGSMGLKRIGENDNKNEKWVKNAKRCEKDTNYCISDSTFETDVYRETYWKNENIKILSFGHPRNDILFVNDEKKEEIRKKVCTFLGIEKNFKLALYAPTFRDSHNLDCYNVDYARLYKALKKRFGGEWIILVRHHFHLWNNKLADSSIQHSDHVVRATDYDDMQELMVAADIGITDYSSWICDFALTNKPGFIFATDMDEYNNERGLYYPLENTPFLLAKNNDELIDNVLTFDFNDYYNKNIIYLKKLGCCEDGHASKRVVEKMKEIMESKK